MRDGHFIESRAILHRWIAFIVFFVSGFGALLYQVIWQRLLVFFSGADVYAVTLIFTTFMAGRGPGSLGGGVAGIGVLARTLRACGGAGELAGVVFGPVGSGVCSELAS